MNTIPSIKNPNDQFSDYWTNMGTEVGKLAVEADHQGHAHDAINLYQTAVDYLQQAKEILKSE